MSSEDRADYLTASYSAIETHLMDQNRDTLAKVDPESPVIRCEYVYHVPAGWLVGTDEPRTSPCLHAAKWGWYEASADDPGAEFRYSCNTHLGFMLEFDLNTVARLDQ